MRDFTLSQFIKTTRSIYYGSSLLYEDYSAAHISVENAIFGAFSTVFR